MNVAVEINHVFLFLFLPLPRLVILKPVKHVLSFYVTVRLEPSGDLLYLFGAGCPYPLPVQVFEHAYLFLRRIPPRTRRGSASRRHFHVAVIHYLRLTNTNSERAFEGFLLERKGGIGWLLFAWVLYSFIEKVKQKGQGLTCVLFFGALKTWRLAAIKPLRLRSKAIHFPKTGNYPGLLSVLPSIFLATFYSQSGQLRNYNIMGVSAVNIKGLIQFNLNNLVLYLLRR